MKSMGMKQTLVWGVLLILAGVLLLFELVADLSPWIWAAALVVGAVVATGLYLTDRSDWAMLLTAYVLWAIALLVVLVSLNILRNEAVAVYSQVVIAIPFLAVYWRDRSQWWALIPAYVLIAVAGLVGLIGLGVLDDVLIPAYVMFVIALPFFIVFLRDRRHWWALIPGGILGAVGLSFLAAGAALELVAAIVLFVIGALVLVRAFTRKEPSPESPPAEPDSEE